MQLKFTSEVLAFLFGVLVIMLTFGDCHINPTIGNLDTIFGHALWPVMDVIYPLATILVFLAYGNVKGIGGLKFNAKAVLPLIAFLLALFLISVDDVSQVLNLGLTFPKTYWIAMMWLYPIVSFLAFFGFGVANEKASK